MCSPSAILFVLECLGSADVRAKSILEVGSRDVNGTSRPGVEALGPASYIGVDIEPGPGVDRILDVGHLVEEFGEDSMDVVISTELVEHVREWREAFDSMKRVLRPGGTLVITTRSPGFVIHGYPYDFWRYTPDDMRAILADFKIGRIEADSLAPGVFAAAVKPADWRRADLAAIQLHSVVTSGRITAVTDSQLARFKLRYRMRLAYRAFVPTRVRQNLRSRARTLRHR